jgi:hypothetical protein
VEPAMISIRSPTAWRIFRYGPGPPGPLAEQASVRPLGKGSQRHISWRCNPRRQTLRAGSGAMHEGDLVCKDLPSGACPRQCYGRATLRVL